MLHTSSFAYLALILSVGVSGVATGVGFAACPLQSLALQHAFVYLSMAALSGWTLSVVWLAFAAVSCLHGRRNGAHVSRKHLRVHHARAD